MFLGLSYCLLFSLFYSGGRSAKILLWVLVVTRATGYRLLRMGWGSYKKFALIRCVRSAFGSVTFEACLMCVVIIRGLMCGGYFSHSLMRRRWFLVIVLPLCYGL